jgi:7-keto-8-aminopelargonate synthetase-like enzyme
VTTPVSGTWLATERPRIFIVTESVFSMDGDFAPLTEIVALKEKYGAWLMVDEAHATGIFGKDGRGFAETCGISRQIEIQMGTLGKALGSSGGYICGSRQLIDFLVNRARSFIFSTAPVPAAAAAATAAIYFVKSKSGEKRRNLLWQRVAELNSTLNLQPSTSSAIIPLIIGDENKALEAAVDLRNQGILIPAIRYPTVARGAARLRLTITAAHTTEDVKNLCEALVNLKPQIVNHKS